MSLVKWFRKNNKKVMAVVVIIIMVGFVGGAALQSLLERKMTELKKTKALFADDSEIVGQDVLLAQQELRILRQVGSPYMLRSIRLPILRAQDLQATFLGELLFAERRTSPQALGLIKRTISQAGYSVSDQQIYDIYNQKYPAEYYWLLLKKEAQLAGIGVTNDKAGEALAGIVPQLFNGAKYSQLIGTVMSQMGVPEETILSAFANLLAVLEYAKMACSAENITDSQVKFSVSMTGETINTEFVKLESSVFAENVDAPSENLVSEHFEKYKTYFGFYTKNSIFVFLEK